MPATIIRSRRSLTSTSESHNKCLLKFKIFRRIGSSPFDCCRFATYVMNTLEIFIFACVSQPDDYLTTIARKSEKAVLPSVFNAFRNVQKFTANPVKTRKTLKMQHFIRLRLKIPTVDIAPVKLYPYVKSKTQTHAFEFASCFCPYRLYPMTHCVPMGRNRSEAGGFMPSPTRGRWHGGAVTDEVDDLLFYATLSTSSAAFRRQLPLIDANQ